MVLIMEKVINMRVCVLYWPISGVGGISTFMKHMKAVADDRGDIFHVICSPNQKGKEVGLLPEPTEIAGGSSSILIDGYAPHHLSNFEKSADFIAKNYDVVLTAHLCPRPNKSYGEEPVFLNLLQELHAKNVRMIGFIHDGYWDTYKEFGIPTLELMQKTIIAQPTYAKPILTEKHYPIEPTYLAIHPRILEENKLDGDQRNRKRVVWLPQWKRIKGTHLMLQGLPEAENIGYDVHLYGCGIDYYNACLEDNWKKMIGKDLFRPDCSGQGTATYFGTRPYKEVSIALQQATFSLDFQGHSAKYKTAYETGSYNYTHLESLYWGCVPVVHKNFLKNDIPDDLVLALDHPETWAKAIQRYASYNYDAEKAREYVLEHHSATRHYDQTFSMECREIKEESGLSAFFV